MTSLLPVAYVRNLSSSHVTWSCIYTRILGIVSLHVMYVRNLSNSQVPWSYIYTLIMESVHSYVLYVRNTSNSPSPWRCIYTLIVEGHRLFLVFVGNFSSRFVSESCMYTLIHSLVLYVWYVYECGDLGGTVVRVLCYRPEDRWFDPSWCHWNFFNGTSLPCFTFYM